jgi:demethylmenaquinone methyltransferase/2-methoxy-6-polyprenyl-1,4-benzoquinol methylase
MAHSLRFVLSQGKRIFMTKTIDFGYQQVPVTEKAKKVAAVFNSVAERYDVMNDLMSLGAHRLWKRFAIEVSGVRNGQQVLDLAGGTGDLALQFAQRVGAEGKVFLADINAAMLTIGRDRLIDHGFLKNIECLQVDAETLPFAENSFDCVSIAFGLRNVTNKAAALASMCRVLRPGGQLLVLEFSKPALNAVNAIYDTYSFSVLPKLGEWVTGDAASYQYLAESIRMHPDQEALKKMIIDAGFDQCEYHNLSGGIVALHRAWKY